MELDSCRLLGLRGSQPEKVPWVSSPGNSLRAQSGGCARNRQQITGSVATSSLRWFLSLELALAPHILDSRRNHTPSQNERTAHEGKGSVLKHLHNQFIWSKFPISQVKIHKSKKKKKKKDTQVTPQKLCFVKLTDGVSTCAPYTRDRAGGWTGLSF